jgi:hypothetical protein
MTVQETEWLSAEAPLTKNESDLLAYFGIPPSPADTLPENIRSKRKFWHRRANGLGEHERAERVKELIQQLSEHLLNGVPFDGVLESGPEGPRFDRTTAETLEELRALIDDLLRRGRFAAAAEAGWRGASQWQQSPLAHLLFAYAVSSALDFGVAIPPQMIGYALKSAEFAAANLGSDETAWLAWVGMLTATGNAARVESLRGSAVQALGVISPNLRLSFAAAVLACGQQERGLVEIVQAALAGGADSGVRADAANQVIRRAAMPLLPLRTPQAAESYRQAVAVAAWCCAGIPDMEEFVRPHRLWASACSKPVYTGNWQIRTFLAVCTGFLVLPLLNHARSRSAWEIFISGPFKYPQEFLLISNFEFMRDSHRHCENLLPWHMPDGRWPSSLDDVTLLRELASQATGR